MTISDQARQAADRICENLLQGYCPDGFVDYTEYVASEIERVVNLALDAQLDHYDRETQKATDEAHAQGRNEGLEDAARSLPSPGFMDSARARIRALKSSDPNGKEPERA